MDIKAFSELFPLFNNANPEIIEGLLTGVTEHEYPKNRAVLMEDSWGNAVYFIISGWVKVRRLTGDSALTLAILGKGDFFGEMAILDESPRSTDVVALSPVKLMSVPAQKFIQTLFKDSQLHHRMLQLMVKRLRLANGRLQLHHQPPAVKLAKTLVNLCEQYGRKSQHGVDILRIPNEDLAYVSDISAGEAEKIVEKLESMGWLKTDDSHQVMRIINFNQLHQLSHK